MGYSSRGTSSRKFRVAPQSRQRFMDKIRKLMRVCRGKSLQQTIEDLNPVLRGWVQYFRLVEVKTILEQLDGSGPAQTAESCMAAMEECP